MVAELFAGVVEAKALEDEFADLVFLPIDFFRCLQNGFFVGSGDDDHAIGVDEFIAC